MTNQLPVQVSWVFHPAPNCHRMYYPFPGAERHVPPMPGSPLVGTVEKVYLATTDKERGFHRAVFRCTLTGPGSGNTALDPFKNEPTGQDNVVYVYCFQADRRWFGDATPWFDVFLSTKLSDIQRSHPELKW